jgi:hypothetical protein
MTSWEILDAGVQDFCDAKKEQWQVNEREYQALLLGVHHHEISRQEERLEHPRSDGLVSRPVLR